MDKTGTGAGRCSARHVSFGALPDGREVQAVELAHADGISARILTLGAALQSLQVPDRHGVMADVLLGFDDPCQYLQAGHYLGATVGRFAGRIAGAHWRWRDHDYSLDANEGRHHLHGGQAGLHCALWQIDDIAADGRAQAVFSHVSPHGAGGYPGALQVTAGFALDAASLTIEYRARTDHPTPVNITSHGYFNLAGEGSGCDVLDHRLTLFADHYLPVDEDRIPTGELRAVAGTAFDFSQPRPIGQRIRQGRDEQLLFGRGYDHGYVIRQTHTDERGLRPLARLHEPWSGRTLQLSGDAPCLQVYSGNALDGRWRGKSGLGYRQSDGLCLEPQGWPAGVGASRPLPAPLQPGQSYAHRLRLDFIR